MCTRSGFTIPRIISLIMLVIAIGFNVTGIVYPVWSEFRFVLSGQQVHGVQNLWVLNIIRDEMQAYPTKEKMDLGNYNLDHLIVIMPALDV